MQILVLGMHRSGSSATTRLLNMMGVYLGPEDAMMLPQSDNSAGFWERQDIADLNDCILSRANASWDDVYPWASAEDDPVVNPADELELSQLIHRMDGNRPWTIKDPRIAITNKLWLQRLEMPFAVLVHRNPLDIARSLNRRNGFSIELGLALWEFYAVSALKAAVNLPHTIVMLEHVLADAVSEVTHLKSSLEAAGVTGLRMPSSEELGRFFSGDKLHRISIDEEKHLLSSAQVQLAEIYQQRELNPAQVESLAVSSESMQILADYHQQCLESGDYVADGEGASPYKDTLLRRIEREQVEHQDRLEVLSRELDRQSQGNDLVLDQLQQNLNRLSDQQQQSIERQGKAVELLHAYQLSLVGRVSNIISRAYKLLTFRRGALNGLENAVEVLSYSEKSDAQASKPKTKLALFAELFVFALKNPTTVFRMLSWRRLKAVSLWFINSPASRIEDLLKPRMDVFAPQYGTQGRQYDIDIALDPATIEFPVVSNPKVSIVIPVYNEWVYTKNCLASIMENTRDIDYEVIVADDQSTDETAHELAQVKNVRHVRNEINLRFVKNCNSAIKQASGDFVLLLNNDTLVTQGWLDAMLDVFEKDESVGIVGPKLLFADGVVQEAGGIIWNDASGWNFGRGMDALRPELNYKREVDYISGACLMLRKHDWDEMGGFDERYVPAYYEDTDLAFEMRRRGKKVVYQPLAEVVHFEGISHGVDLNAGLKAYQVENQKKFLEKWQEVLAEDHYPNGYKVFTARDRKAYEGTILVIDHYVPHYDRDAGSRSTFQYLQLFIELNYKVVFLADNFYQHEPYTTVMQQLGIEVLTGPWYAQNWKDWLAEEAQYIDYIYLHRPHISENYIDFINGLANRPRTIYFGHDLHFLRTQREAELNSDKRLFADAERWKSREVSLFKKVDLSLYPSVVEVEEVLKIDPSIKVNAIPLNIYPDVGSLSKDDVTDEFARRTRITFVGGFGHPPNKDAMKWFVTDVMPLITRSNDTIVLSIVGSGIDQDITDLACDQVEILGTLSDKQLAKTYAQSKIAVVPLRFGAGVKGKVLESLNSGVPVVTTSVGAEGLPEVASALKIEDDAEQFAQAVLSLYENEAMWSEAVEAGYEMIAGHFSREAAIKALQPFFNRD